MHSGGLDSNSRNWPGAGTRITCYTTGANTADDVITQRAFNGYKNSQLACFTINL